MAMSVDEMKAMWDEAKVVLDEQKRRERRENRPVDSDSEDEDTITGGGGEDGRSCVSVTTTSAPSASMALSSSRSVQSGDTRSVWSASTSRGLSKVSIASRSKITSIFQGSDWKRMIAPMGREARAAAQRWYVKNRDVFTGSFVGHTCITACRCVVVHSEPRPGSNSGPRIAYGCMDTGGIHACGDVCDHLVWGPSHSWVCEITGTDVGQIMVHPYADTMSSMGRFCGSREGVERLERSGAMGPKANENSAMFRKTNTRGALKRRRHNQSIEMSRSTKMYAFSDSTRGGGGGGESEDRRARIVDIDNTELLMSTGGDDQTEIENFIARILTNPIRDEIMASRVREAALGATAAIQRRVLACINQGKRVSMHTLHDMAFEFLAESRGFAEAPTPQRLRHYSGIIVRLWRTCRRYLEITGQRPQMHMKNFVIGVLFRMRHGLSAEGVRMCQPDPWLSENLPDPKDVRLFDRDLNGVPDGHRQFGEMFKVLRDAGLLKSDDLCVLPSWKFRPHKVSP